MRRVVAAVVGSSRSDADRLASGELVYHGAVRTPLCALGPRVAWRGAELNVMNEFFATAADVYRLTGEQQGRLGAGLPYTVPRGTYQCADGKWVGLSASSDSVAARVLRLLRVFRTVVDCGGMAAAELELNIGTSTVSRHVKDLETRLGLTLCRRGRAGFSLTPEGEQIYAETLRLLASTDAFRSSVDEIHRRMGGLLTVAVAVAPSGFL